MYVGLLVTEKGNIDSVNMKAGLEITTQSLNLRHESGGDLGGHILKGVEVLNQRHDQPARKSGVVVETNMTRPSFNRGVPEREPTVTGASPMRTRRRAKP